MKANEAASKAKEEAAAVKPKNEMFELLLKSKAEDAVTAASLAVANQKVQERNTERARSWARDDSIRREK